MRWALKQRVIRNVRRRFTHGLGAHRFVKGDLPILEDVMKETTSAAISFEVIAVQPGVSRNELPTGMKNLLAASSDDLIRGGSRKLRVLASE